MQIKLKLHNTLTGKKEIFEPLNPTHVGMYVCGPTVYGEAHLGHARSAIVFDVIFRYLQFLDYKVRYVRNITDVGHLEQDADEGEDKIAKKARLQQLEPMEVAQHYTDAYHRDMELLNVKKPGIEPRATGHILEQIELIEKIINNGFAYEVNGSVYFDVEKYNEHKPYGLLSGRKIEDLQSGTRELAGQSEKRSALDFALWKKAAPEHIMRWRSPWSVGFPGWHLECSAMSAKYLGEQFDIHGGGMDLMFPHHECEIAQCEAGNNASPARYWLHNNMITINGQKMGKSLGNFITLQELFSGNHQLLEQAYSPMTVRFFILQAHYRSTLDFGNEALQAAQKGYKKLINALRILKEFNYEEQSENIDEKNTQQINQICDNCFHAINDDFNTARLVAQLFNLVKKINSIHVHQIALHSIENATFNRMKELFTRFTEDVLGLKEEESFDGKALINALLEFYKEAKAEKDYETVDAVRAKLKQQGIVVKDMKTGIDWAYEE
ncbi:MAG: cysteine--tRNA ligase [Cyclobacteriaceae bacterium]|nr:cysteine--tRNA ligase [Cyclobacteriaceae bacterium]MCH8517556.1 cysteine--tRNA ligase [Cyclobacteriaceae bacterium]